MTLMTAHRILISTAVIFFFGFGLWEMRNYFDTESGWSVFRAGIYFIVAFGFAVYLKSLKKWVQ